MCILCQLVFFQPVAKSEDGALVGQALSPAEIKQLQEQVDAHRRAK